MRILLANGMKMSIVHLKTPVTCVEMSASYTYACHIVCVTELQLNCSNKKNGIGRRVLCSMNRLREREDGGKKRCVLRCEGRERRRKRRWRTRQNNEPTVLGTGHAITARARPTVVRHLFTQLARRQQWQHNEQQQWFVRLLSSARALLQSLLHCTDVVRWLA